jgi:hypothetical protein
VAQLNSASDFGSDGWGFESLRGHLKQKIRSESCGFFCFLKKPNLFEASEENKKNTPTVRRCGFSIFRRGAMGKAQPIQKKKNLKSKLQIPIFFEAELVRGFGRKQKKHTDCKEVWIFYFQAGRHGKGAANPKKEKFKKQAPNSNLL